VEVRPVATQIAQMEKLVESLVEYIRSADQGIQRERQERLDDVALITELITAGWRSVDRRLGRMERLLEESVISNGKRESTTRYVYFDSPPESRDNP